MNHRRMLIVDDEAPIRFAVHRFFEDEGWQVDQAMDAGAAIDMLRQQTYGVVIADLRLHNLADESGFDVVRAARRSSSGCVVIMLTAYGDDSLKRRAWAEGADTFLHKPVSLSHLSDLIESLPQALAGAGGGPGEEPLS